MNYQEFKKALLPLYVFSVQNAQMRFPGATQ